MLNAVPYFRFILSSIALTFSACTELKQSDLPAEKEVRICSGVTPAVVKITGGTFTMGSSAVYEEEGPPRLTRVDGFWIDQTEVTNAQFARFVSETGHVTGAEKPVDPEEFGVPESQIPTAMLAPGSAVFEESSDSGGSGTWRYVPGAFWQKPDGPDGATAQDNMPVVHLSYDDMVVYAAWRGGRLQPKPNGNMPQRAKIILLLSSQARKRQIAGKACSCGQSSD